MTNRTDTSKHIDINRLMGRLEDLAQIGAIDGGGVSRLALTDADKLGRDLVSGWMAELGLEITVDQLGNVIGLRSGTEDGEPVIMGSHIDTVRTGGRYDGNLGVLAGLEVLACLRDAGIATRFPVAVGFFTNEEGARFAPDMMGSGAHQGALNLEDCLGTIGIDGQTVSNELERIGYAGPTTCGSMRARAYLELHIEQGPVLHREGITIGAVEGVQGISWTEVTLAGVSNHAGTTPMNMRADAGFVAADLAVFVRSLANKMGGSQVATVGLVDMKPNLVNVIANRVTMTVDLRNTDESLLQDAEAATFSHLEMAAAAESVTVSRRSLARFAPVDFDAGVVSMVEAEAQAAGYSVRRLPSGAGHDAQMFAPNCPTGMIFVPSVDGISHNVREHTAPADIEAGANVLYAVLRRLAE